MNRINKVSQLQDTSTIDVYFLTIVMLFFGSLIIRLVAAAKLPLNAFESALLMNNPGGLAAWENPISLIESVLIKTTYLVFGQTQLGARLWPALAGSILVTIPLYLKEMLGKKLSLILGLLLAIEPFLLANSLQVGSNIFAILGLTIFLAALVKVDKPLTMIGALILLLSGRGLFPSLVLITILYLFHRNIHALYRIRFEKADIKNIGYSSRIQLAGAVFIAALVVSLLKIDLSSLLATISAYFPQTINPYFRHATNKGLPVVLLSYAPLIISIFVIFCFRYLTRTKTFVMILLIAVIALSLWIIIMPDKNYLDLVWVTLPMLIGCAYYLSELLVQENNPSGLVMFLISIILIISLFGSFSQFIYQGRYGLSQGNSLITMVIIIFLLIFFYFAFLAFGSDTQFLRVTGLSLLVVVSVMQISFSFRAAGFTRNVSHELLLSGAIADADIVMRTVEIRSIARQSVDNNVQIGVEAGLSPQLGWILKNENVYLFPSGASGPLSLDIVLTKENTIQINRKYVGQSMTADVYPKWIETPISSLFDYDYWSWLFFRNSNIVKATHHIWYAMD